MSEANRTYVEKLSGVKVNSGLPYPRLAEGLISGLGGFILIGLLWLLHNDLSLAAVFVIPFGASAVLVFGAPAAPFSQPRNVIGGHVVAALVGVAVMAIFNNSSWYVMAIANGLAIAAMVLTKTVHPPAGATSLLPIVGNITSFMWVLSPVLLGAIIIVVLGLLYNNLVKTRHYPAFWL